MIPFLRAISSSLRFHQRPVITVIPGVFQRGWSTQLPRRNHEISGLESVILIGPDGKSLGTVSLHEAQQRAVNMKLDLVEMSTNPPTCKLMNYNKVQFERKKKLKEKENKSRPMKEVQFGSLIEKHDFDTKLNTIRRLLEKGHPVSLEVIGKGPVERRQQDAEKLLVAIVQNLSEDIQPVQSAPILRGQALRLVVHAKSKN